MLIKKCKKTLIGLFLLISAIVFTLSLTACVSNLDASHVHNYTKTVVAPTCQTGGYTLYSCSCSDSYTTDLTSVVDHDYNYKYLENGKHEVTCGFADCDLNYELDCFGGFSNECNTDRICEECGGAYGVNEHLFLPIFDENCLKEPATCTTPALYWQKCDFCGELGGEPFYMGETLPHNFANYVSNNNATYSTNATETAICENDDCTATDTREVFGSKLLSSVSFKGFTETYDGFYLQVSNSVSQFSFSDYIEITGVANYAVYTHNGYLIKNIYLAEGENKFTVHVNINDTVEIYYLTIYKTLRCQIIFDCENAPDIWCEEGSTITEPDFAPIKTGYDFKSWGFDFSTVITKEMCENGVYYIFGEWEPHKNIPYVINHYVQNVSGYGYTLYKTENLTGEAGAFIEVQDLNSPHLTLTTGNTWGCIDPYGTTVFSFYYKRVTYTITSSNIRYGEINDHREYSSPLAVYGQDLTLTAIPYLGCDFKGWYRNEELISTDYELKIEIDGNLVALFEPIKELTYFYFETSLTSCEISGVIDRTLTSVVIPKCVTKIRLMESNALEYVTVYGSGEIGSRAFRCANLIGVELENVTAIGEEAFYSCEKLAVITLGNGLVEIGKQAFYKCSSLTDIYIPSTLRVIGENAFNSCSNLKKVYIKNLENWFKIEGLSTLLWSSKTLYLNNEELKHLVIPNSVTEIQSYAFHNCDGLESVQLHNNVTAIGDYAFYNCDGLTEFIIPNSVTTVGNYAFAWCENLSSVTLSEKLTTLGNYAFYRTSSLEEITIPNSIKTISEYAFYASGIKSLTLPNGLKDVGWCSFEACRNLKAVTFPTTLESISNYAFSKCSSLTEIYIPGAVWGTNYASFSDCTLLKTVTISEGFISLADSSFKNCVNLTSISLPSTLESVGVSAFEGCVSLENIVIPKNVTRMGQDIFKGCTSLKELTIPFVGRYADFSQQKHLGWIFEYKYDKMYGYSKNETVLENLKKLTVTNTTIIKSEAFKLCRTLEEIILPNTVEVIENEAFNYCYKLKSITIPSSVTKIGNVSFVNCYELESICFEDANNWYFTTNEDDFNNLSNGESVNLSNATENIGIIVNTNKYFYKKSND